MKNSIPAALRAAHQPNPQNSRTCLAGGGGIALTANKLLSFEKTFMVLMLLVVCFSKTEAQGTSPFLQVLDPSSVTLTSTEQAKLSQIQSLTTTASVQHVQVNPIQNYLQGTTLQMQLPDGGGTLAFAADHVNSLPNGDYYWVGANANGSTFRMGKFGSEYLGDLYVAANGYHYSILNLSSNKYILVKRPPGFLENIGGCGTLPEADMESSEEAGDRTGCESNIIRVLFLYTAAASTSSTGINPLTLAPTILAELNASTSASGLAPFDIAFASAGVMLLPGFIESGAMVTDIVSLPGNAAAVALRNGAFADLVILITDDLYPASGKAGIARGTAVSSEMAFCLVINIHAATGIFGSHELAHLIGARHQRCSNCDYDPTSCDDLTNAHGYNVGGDFETIMRDEPCHGTRITRFSNPNAPFMGLSTGTPSNNNAKKLKDRAARVACFRATTTPGVGGYEVFLSAPTYICNGDDEMPVAATFGSSIFLPPVSLTWEFSATGVGGWMIQTYCNGSQCTLTGLDIFSSDFFVRVTACDSEGNCVSAMQRVKVVLCGGGGGGDRNPMTNNTNIVSTRLQVFPNPATDQLHILGLDDSATVTITDASGKTVFLKNGAWPAKGQETIDISGFAPGLYFVSVQQNQSVHQTKITKL